MAIGTSPQRPANSTRRLIAAVSQAAAKGDAAAPQRGMAVGDRSPSVRPSQTTLAVESPFPRPCRIRRRSRSVCPVAAARRPCARCFRGRRYGEGEALPSGCAHRRVERRRKGSPRQAHPCLGESLALIGEGLARYLGFGDVRIPTPGFASQHGCFHSRFGIRSYDRTK